MHLKISFRNSRWQPKKIFWEKSPDDSADTLGITWDQNFAEKCIFAFYSEIQDGHPPKMAGKRFWGKIAR